ncbi:MAG: hypothetical protein GY906_30170 [bacterium]|nr:hypothetical protein [bacterium]
MFTPKRAPVSPCVANSQSPIPDVYLGEPIPRTADDNRVYVPIYHWRQFRIRLKVSEDCVMVARYADVMGRRYQKVKPPFHNLDILAGVEYCLSSDNHMGEYYLYIGFNKVAAEMTGYVTITGEPV